MDRTHDGKAFRMLTVIDKYSRETFYTLKEAQTLIEQWRHFYITERPHGSLGYRPPAPEAILPSKKGMLYAENLTSALVQNDARL